MKLLKPSTMAVFALGFLAGSRSGSGPWETVQSKLSGLQNRAGGGYDGLQPVESPVGGDVRPGAMREF